MSPTKAISSFLQKALASHRRDGVSAAEAAKWLTEAGMLGGDTKPAKRLRALFRDGKVKGAYQFPNKRWVIVNSARLPDGLQRVVPIKEAARFLKASQKTLNGYVDEGRLQPLDFGVAPVLFLEEELRRFQQEFLDRSYELGFAADVTKKGTDVDKLKRQLYYLRSDIRLIVERIEELIRLLD